MINNQIIKKFQQKILDWYEKNQRDLPWRKTTDPYAIWISESMLCQTQVSRVVDYYHKRLDLFPTIEVLANASNEEVLRAWSGLGYNSRALRLKQAANVVLSSKLLVHSYFASYDNLIALPWVGEYIANAVLAFAYNKDVVVVDTNIRRIMIQSFLLPVVSSQSASTGNRKFTGLEVEQVVENNKWLREMVWETLPKGNARVWYNALMDYGALEMTANKTWIKSLTKQSKFQGSARQVRAWIIKWLLRWDSSEGLCPADIEKLYPERDDLDQIISKMIKERVVEMKNLKIQIKN